MIQEHRMWHQRLSVRGASCYLNFLGKKGSNSKNIDFRVMPTALQLHLAMFSKYTKFSVDTFNTIWVMGHIKVFAWWQQQQWRQQPSDHFQTDQLKIKKILKTYDTDAPPLLQFIFLIFG